MDSVISFIKSHRRDITISAAALAASLAVMLAVPAAIIRGVPSTAGMMACLALFFFLDPAYCLAAAIFAGWDLRRRWFTALFPPLVFLLSAGTVFSAVSGAFMVYFVIYSVIVLTAAPVTHLVRKYGNSAE